jgi:zinc protease
MRGKLLVVLLPSAAIAEPLAIEERTLENGLRVVRVGQEGAVVAAAGLVIAGGAALDGPRHGEASLAYSLHFGQDARAERMEIVKALAESGSDFSFAVHEDHVRYAIFGLGDQIDEMIQLLGVAVGRPRKIDRDSFERRRVGMVDSLWEAESHPVTAAELQLDALAFGVLHPYGHPAIGSRRTLGQIELQGLEKSLDRSLCPDRSALVVAGSVRLDDVSKIAAKSLGKWKACRAPPLEAVPSPERDRKVVPIIHDPDRAQVVVLGAAAVPIRDASDVAALELVAEVLGGSIASRLQVALRAEGGYTYGAHGGVHVRRGVGALLLRTSIDRETAGPALAKLIETVQGIRTTPPTASELARARRKLATERAIGARSCHEVLDEVATRFAAGLSLVEADVGDERVAQVARAIDAGRLHMVLVGDARALPAVVRAAGLGEPKVVSRGG